MKKLSNQYLTVAASIAGLIITFFIFPTTVVGGDSKTNTDNITPKTTTLGLPAKQLLANVVGTYNVTPTNLGENGILVITIGEDGGVSVVIDNFPPCQGQVVEVKNNVLKIPLDCKWGVVPTTIETDLTGITEFDFFEAPLSYYNSENTEKGVSFKGEFTRQKLQSPQDFL